MKYIFPVLAILCYGLAPVFQKAALKRIKLRYQFLIHGVTIFIIYSTIFLLYRSKPIDSNTIWAVFSGSSSVIGFIFYYEALKKGNASIVTAITSSYALFTVLLTVLTGDEKLNYIEIIGIIIIITGIVLLDLSHSRENVKNNIKTFRLKEAILTVLATLCWGSWAFFTKKAVYATGEVNTLFTFGVIALLVFPVYFLFRKDSEKDIERSSEKFYGFFMGAISVFVIGTASFSFYFSVTHFRIAILTPLVTVYPVITVILSTIFLKEYLTFKQIMFILMIICGVVLLNLG